MSDGLLSQLAELRQPIEDVRGSIERLIDPEYSETWSDLRVDVALAEVESSVERWAQVSSDVERRLLDHRVEVPDDSDAVQARVGGIAMLHIAVACDVARLLPFEDPTSESTVAEVHESALGVGEELIGQADTIRDAALAPGTLIESMSTVDAQTSGDGEAEGDDLGPDTPGEIVIGPVIKEDFDAMAGDVIDEVVTDIVERASRSASAVVLGLAGGGGHLFIEFMPHLSSAVSAAPDDVRNLVVRTVGRVARLVKVLLARARKALNAVLGGYKAAVQDLIGAADPGSWVGEAFAGNILGRVVRSKDVRRSARAGLGQAPRKNPRVKRLRELMKTHQKWVGPVRIVARGLPHLWAVPLGAVPIPAAPVAAIGLLGWTVLITGDQLDSPHFPDLWKGVIRRASGE